ncbi:MAG: hypothetical protein QF410_12345, partial [Planctomycetota bacterium]|nr:hypothetical protein [Planctomycetota bacterium]
WGGEALEGGDRRLFHLAEDPGQLHDVAEQHPERVEVLQALLLEHLRRAHRRKPRYTVGSGGRTEQMLRDIGYIDRDEEEPHDHGAHGRPGEVEDGR